MVAGKKKIKQRRARAADMQITGRTGGETSANLRHGGKLTGSGKSVNGALKTAADML